MFHYLVVIHNLEEPKRYDRKIKWLITIIVAAAAVLDPLGTFTFWRMTPSYTLTLFCPNHADSGFEGSFY